MMVTDYTLVAWSQWPKAFWIVGEGRHASISECGDEATVLLCETLSDAMEQKAFIDRIGCGHKCRRQRHRIVDLATFPVPAKGSRNVSQATKIAVAARDQGQCVRCGSGDDLQFDHVFPWSKGGNANPENIQLLCKKCNQEKGARK